ncbi:MAG: hypothetical protein K2X99_06535 [Gemmatimonadaceae bacterium]|nr:hypothetical protein [Gemmatimonadaceae bacterium]
MLMRHAALRATGAALALVSTACATYRPTTAPLTAAQAVRVRLSDAGTTALGGTLGKDVASIDGEVSRASADTLWMTIASLRQRDGNLLFSQGTNVAIARTHVASTELRTISRSRSLLVAAATAVAAAAIVASVKGGGGGVGSGGAPPGSTP